MKRKNFKNTILSIEYLFKIGQLLSNELGRRKIKELLQLANKNQIRLGKIKHCICKKCFTFLTPKINCKAQIEKSECGLRIVTTCDNCNTTTFKVKRNV